MDNIFGDLQEKFKQFQASEEFDKQGLIEAHERFFDSLEMVESNSNTTIRTTLSEDVPPTVPLRGLRSIRAKELVIGKHHHGRILFGTLCADAHRIVSVMTVLEDQSGDGVRLAIYNPSLCKARTPDVRKRYPKGAKVAVKEPYFKRAQDGLVMLRADNHQNVVIFPSFSRNAETVLVTDLVELRAEGNERFRAQDWKGAIEYYCKCIEMALSRYKIEPQTPSSSSSQKQVMEALLYSYSNCAEARLKLKEYAQAAEDSEKALEIDPHHLKSIFRKGRAFHELGEYKLACCCFQLALEQSPDSSDIKLEFERSKKFNEQNQQGKFDLSAYFLNGFKAEDIPEASNYIGPVIIKKAARDGRGLFATKDMAVGETLLIENAMAMMGMCSSIVGHDLASKSKTVAARSKAMTVDEVISCALSSSRILQQLQYLADPEEEEVPDMEVFRINNGNWNKFGPCKTEKNSEVNMDKLKQAMELNVLLTRISNDEDVFPGPKNRWRGCRVDEQIGFWALANFINHSCFPNAKWMVVGQAMYIIAVREIAAGEEITVSYFHSLVPLAKREHICRKMGFVCDCKRCMLERSLDPAFRKLEQSLDDVVVSGRLLWLYNRPRRYVESYAELVMQLEKEIDAQGNAITPEGKQLIRAAFQTAYVVIFVCADSFPEVYVPSPLPSLKVEVAEAMEYAAPGFPVSFQLLASLLDGVHEKEKDIVFQNAMRMGITLFGRHEEYVLNSLLEAKPLLSTVNKDFLS